MALKRTSLKLLSWLYPVKGGAMAERGVQLGAAAGERSGAASGVPSLAPAELALLLPELSPGGRRSLVALLVSQGLLRREPTGSGFELTLSTHGQEALRAQFAAWRFVDEPWDGSWSAIVFLSAPKSDPAFRFLRTKLLAVRAAALRPGIYLYPGALPSELRLLLRELYVGRVLVWETSQWRFGDERQIVAKMFSFSDTLAALSGVSKEIESLLTIFNEQNKLTNTDKLQIYAVFDRLTALMGEELGLINHYYETSPRFEQLVSRLQNLEKL